LATAALASVSALMAGSDLPACSHDHRNRRVYLKPDRATGLNGYADGCPGCDGTVQDIKAVLSPAAPRSSGRTMPASVRR